MKVRIGTRGSDLALWQAHFVRDTLIGAGAEVELVIIETRGDANQASNKPLQAMDGQSFFTAEIERALLDDEIDIAVHSHKDLETVSDPALVVGAVPMRGFVEERLLISKSAYDVNAPLLPLARGAKVGTSSPRRRALLKTLRGDLVVKDLRGNVPTRVRRCVEGKYDAVLLARAGLERLALDVHELHVIDAPPELLVPAPAQGALALQVRAADRELRDLLRSCLHDPATMAAVEAERWLLVQGGGGCHLPLGVFVSHDPLVEELDAQDDPDLHGHGPVIDLRARAQARIEGDGPFRAVTFLGADEPDEGHPPRWVTARGDSPQAAVERAWERLRDEGPTRTGPLTGVRVVLVGSSQGGTTLGDRLTSLGAEVMHEKVLEFRGVKAPELPAKLARLKPDDVLVVTSQEAARRLSGHRVPSGVVVAAVGPGTARALSTAGLKPKIVGKGGARALAALLDVPDGGRVLFPCAEGARPELPASLRERGVEVDSIAVYRTIASEGAAVQQRADVVVYMSPSAVTTSVSQGREGQRGRIVRVGLGRATCDALQDEDLSHERPQGSGPEPLVALLCKLLGPRLS